MAESTLTVPLIKPGYTLRVVFEHAGQLREALWFKYKKNGDFILFPRVLYRRVGHGSHRNVDDLTGAGAAWLSPDFKRDHFTIHPSMDGNPEKAGVVVNGLGGRQPVGLDLRTIERLSPLFEHRLTIPEAYPEADQRLAHISLGRAYISGAPAVHVWASPIDRAGHAGEALPPAASGGVAIAIAPSKLDNRRYLLHVRLTADPALAHWPYDTVSFPVMAPKPSGTAT